MKPKEYELTDEEMNLVHDGEIHGDDERLAQAAQKKLLKWLVENDLLSHLPFTGATPTKPCEMCQLLKDFGIS